MPAEEYKRRTDIARESKLLIMSIHEQDFELAEIASEIQRVEDQVWDSQDNNPSPLLPLPGAQVRARSLFLSECVANARPPAVDLSDGVAARERWVLCHPLKAAGTVVRTHGVVTRRENRELRQRDGSFFACVAGGLGSCVLPFAIIFESLTDVKFARTSSRKF